MRFDAQRDLPARRLRALFLSDVHLGAPASKSGQLAEFLRHHEADIIYLVGDIVDGWHLRSRWHWPKAHADVVDAILSAARAGARVVYLPGNHDAFLRDFYGTHFAGIEVAKQIVHEAADGRRYLVIHGDDFDDLAELARRWSPLGNRAQALLTGFSNACSGLQRRLGLKPQSLARWLKFKVKRAVNYVGAFEKALSALAQKHEVDGIICGHVHHAAIHQEFGVRYINCGDWVESCTAAVEHTDGSFEIVSWPHAGEPRARTDTREELPEDAMLAGRCAA